MEEKKEFGLEFVNIRLNHDRTLFTDKRIDNPDAAVDLLRNEMQYYDREHVIALFMDSANQVLNASICHIGAINKSVVETASILKPALLMNAAHFIILHNHPSGNPEPSIDDINVTKKLEIAGKIFDITLLDHIIVGSEEKYYSFAKEDKIGHAKLVIYNDNQLGEKNNNYSVKEKSSYQSKEKQSFREQMAEAFIKSLEENPKHWIKKWSSNETGRAYNMSSGIPYSGNNAIWLKFVETNNGYNDPRWLTFNQVIKMNEKLKDDEKIKIPKGTKMTKVEYYFMYDNLNHKTIDWVIYNSLSEKDKKEVVSVEDKKTGETVVKQRYVLCSKDHYVFNAAQLENIPKFEVERTVNDIEPSLIVDSIAEGMGVQIIEKEQDRAFYTPLDDQIVLPCRYQFDSDYDYQATALHELGHATGHSKRLNRPLSTRFGSEEYAYEELVAEMTSCFMSEYVESPMSEADMENHVAYVQSWIKSIKNDKNYLFKAIKEANKAADYMIEKGGLEDLKEAQNVSERHMENWSEAFKRESEEDAKVRQTGNIFVWMGDMTLDIPLIDYLDIIAMQQYGYKGYEEYRADGEIYTKEDKMYDFTNVAPYKLMMSRTPDNLNPFPIRFAKDLEEGKQLFDEICNINKLGRNDVYNIQSAEKITLVKYEYDNDGKVISNEIVKELDNNVLANLKDECIEKETLYKKKCMALKVGDNYLSILKRQDANWEYSIYDMNFKLLESVIIKYGILIDNKTIIDIAKYIIEDKESFKKDGITYADSEEIDYGDLGVLVYKSEHENIPLIKNNEYESEIEDKAEKRANLFEGIKTSIVSKMKKSFAKKEYEEEL